MNLYETLGINETATPEEIKKAYRTLAQKNHPDKGGDVEAFQQIQKAYAVLSDEDSRAHYDRTGDDDGAPNIRKVAFTKVAQLFAEIVEGDMAGNIIEECKAIGKGQIQKCDSMVAKNNRLIEKFTKQMSRVKNKNGGENIFQMVIEAKLHLLNTEIEDATQSKALFEAMLEIIDEHEDTKPKIAEPRAFEAAMFAHGFGQAGFNRFFPGP